MGAALSNHDMTLVGVEEHVVVRNKPAAEDEGIDQKWKTFVYIANKVGIPFAVMAAVLYGAGWLGPNAVTPMVSSLTVGPKSMSDSLPVLVGTNQKFVTLIESLIENQREELIRDRLEREAQVEILRTIGERQRRIEDKINKGN